MNTNTQPTPAEVYLAELRDTNRPKITGLLETVASLQGFSDWRVAPWQQITVDDLPVLFARLQAKYPDPADVKSAIAVIKGIARCAWRQKLMSSEQLAEISKWKGDR